MTSLILFSNKFFTVNIVRLTDNRYDGVTISNKVRYINICSLLSKVKFLLASHAIFLKDYKYSCVLMTILRIKPLFM